MFGKYPNIRIAGIAAVAPKRTVDNIQFAEEFGDKRAKRQVMLTGINRRHLCQKGQSASDMATDAAKNIMEELGWKPEDIRVLVFVTQSPDVVSPSTAMIIQKRLKIGHDCFAFDVNLGCTGYVSGLQIVSALLQSTGGKGLLLVGDGKYYGETTKVDTNALLFGDGAAATAMEICEKQEGILYSQYTDGTRHELITMSLARQMKMDGNAVLLFSLEEVSQSIKDTKEYFKISEDSIDYYVFHQAQKLIIDGMANECDINSEKVLISYNEFGNTSTATLPITICQNASQIKKDKHVRLFLSGFGVGLAWANVILEMDTEHILPVVLSEHFYGDVL